MMTETEYWEMERAKLALIDKAFKEASTTNKVTWLSGEYKPAYWVNVMGIVNSKALIKGVKC